MRFAPRARTPPQRTPRADGVDGGGGDREPDADPEEDERPVVARVGDQDAADGEVEDFFLWPIERVVETVRETDRFKFNVNLVLIDLFRRNGVS